MEQGQNSNLSFADSRQYILEGKKIDLGFLGKFFGSHDNAPANIAGLVLVILIITGVIILFWGTSVSVGVFWDKIVPIVTLTLGYLFGKKI